MEIEFLSRKDNALLQRVELQFKITHQGEGSPAREAVRDAIAKREKVGKELVIIDHMRSDYGLPNTIGFAKVYRSKETIMETERKYVLIRNKLLADDRKKVAPKPKEKKPEAEPKEEEKEPKKPEEKEEKPKEKKAKEDKDVKPEKDARRKDVEKQKDEAKKPQKGEPKNEKASEKAKK